MLIAISLVGCSHSQSPVSVVQLVDDSAASESIGGKRITIIQPEDTLYSIGFENSIDVRDLLAWNGLSEARNLQVGQRIRLTKPLNYVEPKVSEASVVTVEKVPVFKPTKSTSTPKKTEKRQLEESRADEPVKKVTPEKNVSPTIVQTKENKEALYIQKTKNIRWSWPVKGQVIGWFSLNKAQKGLDIRTVFGQQVKTAAAGKVVYQGSGIKGYGNLIIIKHSEEMLSAYAHNSQVLVHEGEYVGKDKVISLAGQRKGEPLLHFEIRKKGKPVNPMKYLR